MSKPCLFYKVLIRGFKGKESISLRWLTSPLKAYQFEMADTSFKGKSQESAIELDLVKLEKVEVSDAKIELETGDPLADYQLARDSERREVVPPRRYVELIW